MNPCPFCNLDAPPEPARPTSRDGDRPIGLRRRAGRALQWLFPTALLVLTPKCPMCIVAYVAWFTGIGIAASTARWIQILIPVVGLTALAVLAWHAIARRRKMKSARNRVSC